MGILDFFSREAGQERRRALDSLLSQFIPPTARPQFNLLGELNPVVAMERAGQDAQRIGATQGWERVGATGDMLSNMAGVVAPALAMRGAGRPVAQAVEEGLLGFSTSPQGLALGDFVADEFGGLRLFRGDTESSERITGGIGEGLLFGTPYEDVARLYGDKISQFYLPDGARVLTEGSKEFSQVTGRKKGPLLRNLRLGENLTSAANDAIERARAAGYDAVEFNSTRDMGVAVLNPNIVLGRHAP